MRRLTLLVNADNTLWESNVFFENTLERFFSLVEPFGYARAYARHILNETERQNIQQHGYGVRSFARSLEQSYMKLAGGLAQRSALDGLKDTSAKAADALKSSCPTTFPSTAAARLDAVEARLKAMDQAVKAIRPALDAFYTSLTDEQKARFNMMGQSQSGTGQIAHRHG